MDENCSYFDDCSNSDKETSPSLKQKSYCQRDEVERSRGSYDQGRTESTGVAVLCWDGRGSNPRPTDYESVPSLRSTS